MSTLFERLGGQGAISEVVESFYRKVLTDKRISRFFDDTDMDMQLQKQEAFLTMVFGGPTNYTGLAMREAHQHLVDRGLNDEHVDAVIELLGQSLAECGATPTDIGEVAAIANSVRNDVLCR